MLEIYRESARQNPLLAVALGFTFFFIFQLTLIPIYVEIVGAGFGLDSSQITDWIQGKNLEGPLSATVVRWINAGNNLFSWGLPAVLVAWFLGNGSRELGVRQGVKISHLGLAPLIILASFPLAQALQLDSESFRLPEALAELESSLQEIEAQVLEMLLHLLGDVRPGALLINLLVFAVIPAVCEELFFRGLIQRQLGKIWKPWVAIFITATLFSLIHFQFYGFFARLFLGMVLGYLYYRSGSLWPSILGHFCFNAANVVLVYGVKKYQWFDGAMLETAPPIAWETVAFGGLAWLGLSYLYGYIAPKTGFAH